MDKAAIEGDPFDMKTLLSVVYSMCQKIPGKKWCNRFLKRHSDKLTLAKATSLDPMHEKNFNKPTVNDYFNQIAGIKEKYGNILALQIWNMDKKGIQLGGGWKQGQKKFFFMKKHKNYYRLQSNNLELATVLECVSAVGGVAPTMFILRNGPWPDIRGVEDVGW